MIIIIQKLDIEWTFSMPLNTFSIFSDIQHSILRFFNNFFFMKIFIIISIFSIYVSENKKRFPKNSKHQIYIKKSFWFLSDFELLLFVLMEIFKCILKWCYFHDWKIQNHGMQMCNFHIWTIWTILFHALSHIMYDCFRNYLFHFYWTTLNRLFSHKIWENYHWNLP